MMPVSNRPPFLPFAFSLSAELVVSHVLAALVALALVNAVGAVLALTVAALTGLALTLALQRSLWMLDAAVQGGPVSLRGHGPLKPLLSRVQSLIAQEQEVSDLRKNLVRRVQDTAAQQERNRLARDLHDSIKQQIFGIQMSAAAVQARWTQDPDGALASLEDVRRSAREAMAEMNALLQELAPAPLEKVGLVQALRDQCEALGYRAGVEVRLDIGDLPDDALLPAGTPMSVFRMVQEALSNIARHARAHQVEVRLGQEGAALVLDIRDDGQGFQIETADKGMGLTNLRQRVGELGGMLVMNSAPGQGTHLRAAIPFVELLSPLEEIVTINTHHTLNKVFLTGLAGGIGLIVALYYPLYVLLPHNELADWQNGSGFVGIVLEVVAALLTVGTGYAAARWIKADSRRSGMLLGALAGLIAGIVAYMGVIGIAAGVVGGSPLVQHGVAAAADEREFYRLLVEPLVGILWWTYSALWGVIAAGIGLGALGGALSAVGNLSLPWKDIRFAVVIPVGVGVVLSAVNLWGIFAIFSLLEPAVQTDVTQFNLAIPSPLVNGISLLPIGTAMSLFVALMAVFYYLMQAESREDQGRWLFVRPLALAVIYGLLALSAFLLGVYSLFNPFNLSVRVTLLGGGLMSLILAAAFVSMALNIRRDKIAEGQLDPLTGWQIAAFVGYAVGLALIGINSLGLSILLASFLIARREDRKTPLDVRQMVKAIGKSLRSGHIIPAWSIIQWFWFLLSIVLALQLVWLNLPLLGIALLLGVIANLYGPLKPSRAAVSRGQMGQALLQGHIQSLVATVTTACMIVMTGAPAVYSIVLLIVPTITVVAGYDHTVDPASVPPMSQLVQSAYILHLQALVLGLVIAAMVTGLVTLIGWGVFRWTQRGSVRGVKREAVA